MCLICLPTAVTRAWRTSIIKEFFFHYLKMNEKNQVDCKDMEKKMVCVKNTKTLG